MTRQKECPGTLAGATGADVQEWLSWIDHNIERENAAREFALALLKCDPADRLELLEVSIEALRPGWPVPPFGRVMDEASFWADMASRAERKAYMLACFERLSVRDQSGFLAYAQRRSAA